jgi:predicted GH43/DUF377 family glycosyl hydrolase
MKHLALFALALTLPFGALKRLTSEPILRPQGNGFESAGVFNPAVVRRGKEVIMLYRAQDRNGTSRMGYASSTDGIHFTRRPEPVFSPDGPFEKDGGVEDPRLVEIGGLYYLTYTAYNKKDAQLCLATSKDLIHWNREGVMMPAYKGRWNVGWTKSGAIVPEKRDGKYWMYFMGDAKDRPGQMGIASSSDLRHWTEPLAQPILPTRPGKFDSKVAEPGPAPVLTKDGIFLIYNGADDNLVYRTGWALFDANDPAKVLARSDTPIFAVEQSWEKTGQVPNVVFVEGLLREPKRWLFYYGAADQYIGVAEAPAL